MSLHRLPGLVGFNLEDAFNLLSGEPKIYIKTAASGATRVQAFCPECGSQIYATSPGDGPKVHGIRLGTARQRGELAPRKQVWHRSAQAWVVDLGAIPAID